MSKELSDSDILLLKKHFNTKLRFIGFGLHKTIDEHKETPVSILKLIIETPKRKIEVSQSILIAVLAIAFTIAIGYESSDVSIVFNLMVAIVIIIMLFSVIFVVIWFLGVNEMEDQKWFLLKMMIALKEDNEAIKKDIRMFLQSRER